MKEFGVVIAFLLAGVAWGQNSCTNPNGSQGCTLSGATNLDYFGSPTAASCKSTCDSDGRCVGWAWVRPGGFRAGDPPICYRVSSFQHPVASSCCVAGWKTKAAPPAVVDMRGVWTGGFRCGSNQYRNTLNVTAQNGDAFSGVTEDNAPFNGRVQADGQANLSRPSWAQEYGARVTRTATGLRFDGTDVKNPSCGFTSQSERLFEKFRA